MSSESSTDTDPPIQPGNGADYPPLSTRRSADLNSSKVEPSPSPTASTPTLYQPTDKVEPRTEEEQSTEEEPVGRKLTKQTTSQTPPYTIHSNSVKWLIILIVSTAAMMSYVERLSAEYRIQKLTSGMFSSSQIPPIQSTVPSFEFSPLSANIYLPVIPAVSQDLKVSTQSINLSVTVYMIFQGTCNFTIFRYCVNLTFVTGITPSFFASFCDVLGRRPIYIVNFIM